MEAVNSSACAADSEQHDAEGALVAGCRYVTGGTGKKHEKAASVSPG